MIILRYLLYFPLLMRFKTAQQKNLIIKDMFSKNPSATNNIDDLFIYMIGTDVYFRTIFYHRTRGFFTNVLRMFFPKEKYFIIDSSSTIGGGITAAHPYGTIINAASIGDNLYINHLVTIGEKNGKKPIIGSNVELHANCTIVGGITIGNNVIIGAGTVVTKDVPDNTVVVGATNRYLAR